MRRTLVTLGLTVVLTACVPGVSGNADEARLLVDRQGEMAEIVVDPGPRPAESPTLLIGGQDLEVVVPQDAPCARRPSGRIGCELPNLVAGGRYVLRVRGEHVRANLTFYRPGSDVVFGIRGLDE